MMMQNKIYFDNDQEEVPKNIRRRKKQLYELIRERMEFYFSDSNLQKDRFLSQLLKDDPEVDLEIFLKFNKIHQLTTSLHDLKKALKKSEFLSLTEDKSKVYRNTPVKEKLNVDACTIYVEQLSYDADHDWLKLIFSRYGKVDYISIPKYKGTGKIKGFAFVEFETPESAKAALDEFEKEGCCLTNHMNPEKLCSIATFEDDKYDNKNQKNNNDKSLKPYVVKVQEDVDNKTYLKRKQEKSEEEEEGGGEDDDEEFEPEVKKIKFDETESEQENDKNNEGINNINISESDNDKKSNSQGIGVVTKKKKNRKKKKSLKTKYYKDIKMYGLQILSKTDWKRLRNKYLNIQKEKMKKLKQHLYKNQMNQLQRQQQYQQQQQQQQLVNNQGPECQTKPRFQFSKGLIIKINLDTPIKDGNHLNQFKCDAKSLEKVEYVDVGIGSDEAYVRFADENAVSKVLESKPWNNFTVLKGNEEEEYWEKMKRDRSEKFDNKKKFSKRRGRNKIIDKTEKLMSKRIRLSVDE